MAGRPLTARHSDAAAAHRPLAAMLRWRVRWLRSALPERTARAALAVPLLLHACFTGTALCDEAPGVRGLRFRRSWNRLARELGLPAPTRPQRGAPRVEAVLAIPSDAGLEVLAVVAKALDARDLAAVRARVEAVEAVLASSGAALVVRAVDAHWLARDPMASHRIATYGALLGGLPSETTWLALESSARAAVGPRVFAALDGAASTPLAHLALALLAGSRAPAPIAAAARLLRQGEPARRLAVPAHLLVAWAAGAGRCRGALLDALAIARGDRETDAAALVALGRTLSREAAAALRRSRRSIPAGVLAAWHEAIGPGFPRALLPALARRLTAGDASSRLEVVRDGRVFQARLDPGPALGRGATPIQARVRALAILAAAMPEAIANRAEPPWGAVAARLAEHRDRPILVLVVEPTVAQPGPPFDPLNRGPSRALGFSGGLAVWLRPGRRPAARILLGESFVVELLKASAAGGTVEVLPARPEANPVAARLSQVAALARRGGAERMPVAIEAGGAVLVAGAGRVRRHVLDRWLARPQRVLADPDAPDLALTPGVRSQGGLGAANLIECRAQLLDEARAAVLYADARGDLLREVVFLWELEEHLASARRIVQAADPTAVIALRPASDLEPALRRAGPPGPAFAVSVGGRLPHGIEVEVGDCRYGGRTGRSWREAAEAVLAHWRRGEERRLEVASVAVWAGRRRAGGILALWARSVALRRLRIHLVAVLRTYQPAGADRRNGREGEMTSPHDHQGD